MPQRDVRQLINQALTEENCERFEEKLAEILRVLNEDDDELSADGRSSVNRPTDITFDIFSGLPDRDSVWIDAVVGIDKTRQRMNQLTAEKPGDYFIFDVRSGQVVDRTATCQPSSGSAKTPKRDVA